MEVHGNEVAEWDLSLLVAQMLHHVGSCFSLTLPKQELDTVPVESSTWTSLDFRGHFQIQGAFLLLNRQL